MLINHFNIIRHQPLAVHCWIMASPRKKVLVKGQNLLSRRPYHAALVRQVYMIYFKLSFLFATVMLSCAVYSLIQSALTTITVHRILNPKLRITTRRILTNQNVITHYCLKSQQRWEVSLLEVMPPSPARLALSLRVPYSMIESFRIRSATLRSDMLILCKRNTHY